MLNRGAVHFQMVIFLADGHYAIEFNVKWQFHEIWRAENRKRQMDGLIKTSKYLISANCNMDTITKGQIMRLDR